MVNPYGALPLRRILWELVKSMLMKEQVLTKPQAKHSEQCDCYICQWIREGDGPWSR